MNPWLQRLLISAGAAVATSAAVIGTAQNRNKRTKRRRKKRDPPVVLGTVAKRDAAADVDGGITVRQWVQGMKDSGQRFIDFITRKKKPEVNESGALEPDEVRAADGTRLKVAKRKGKKKLTPSQLRRQRRRFAGKRKQASLFDSARESFRQVVKEEAGKVIDDKVEATGLKKAADALKSAGEKVGGAVKDAATKVKDGIPEDAQEQVVGGLQTAGKSLLAGAKKFGQSVSQAVQTLQQEVSSSSSSSLSSDGESLSQASDPQPPATTTSLQTTEPVGVTPPVAPAIPSEGFTASDVGDKVQDGVQKIGAFLSGPGNPGYKKSGRIGHGGSGADVVEAKDPPSKDPSAP